MLFTNPHEKTRLRFARSAQLAGGSNGADGADGGADGDEGSDGGAGGSIGGRQSIVSVRRGLHLGSTVALPSQ